MRRIPPSTISRGQHDSLDTAMYLVSPLFRPSHMIDAPQRTNSSTQKQSVTCSSTLSRAFAELLSESAARHARAQLAGQSAPVISLAHYSSCMTLARHTPGYLRAHSVTLQAQASPTDLATIFHHALPSQRRTRRPDCLLDQEQSTPPFDLVEICRRSSSRVLVRLSTWCLRCVRTRHMEQADKSKWRTRA